MTPTQELFRELHDLATKCMLRLSGTGIKEDLLLADELHRNWTKRQQIIGTFEPQRYDSQTHDEIARVLDASGDVQHNQESYDIMMALAVLFQADNPRFDSQRFFTLAGRK